jgi:hypothetical protein
MLYKETLVVDAIQWTGSNFQEIESFLPPNAPAIGNESGRDRRTGKSATPAPTEVLIIHNPPHAELWVRPGDWITLRGRSLRVVSSESFSSSFQEVREATSLGARPAPRPRSS